MRQLKKSAAEPLVEELRGPELEELENPFRRESDPLAPGALGRRLTGFGDAGVELTRETAADALGFEKSEKSLGLGLLYFGAALAFYAATLASAYLFENPAIRFAASIINGLAIGILFIAGHDACHGALTPYDSVNRWIARISFLPSLHTYSAWVYSHNILHHGWTNLKSRDPVYAPKSRDEYDALTPLEKLKERIYRSFAGVGFLYLDTIWLQYEFLPDKRTRNAISRYGNFGFDRVFVLSFLILHILGVILLTDTAQRAAVSLALGLVAPFLVWNWLMGFVTYLHHTHPAIRWFDTVREWSFVESQVEGSAHVIFPAALDFALLRIMQHTAHHICPEIPLYRLRGYQKALDRYAVNYKLTWKNAMTVFRTCKLYDYAGHQWVPFKAVRANGPKIG